MDGGGAPAARLCARAPKQIPKTAMNNTDGTAAHILIFMIYPLVRNICQKNLIGISFRGSIQHLRNLSSFQQCMEAGFPKHVG